MGRRLLNLDAGKTGFSPFIDVAINGMAAMFIFLVIYVAVVRPHPIPPLRVLSQSLPRAVWMRPYEAAIVVTGGQPHYSFRIPDSQIQELASIGLSFDPATGRIAGTPRLDALESLKKGRKVLVSCEVADQSGQLAATPQSLELTIAPMHVPFDPEQDRLRFAASDMPLPDAVLGRPYAVAVPVLGGIEPYQMAVAVPGQQSPGTRWAGLPPGLTVQPATGRIEGTPQETAVPAGAAYQTYHLRLSLVDQQSANLPESNRHPRVEGRFVLREHRVEALAVTGPFPSSGRAGLEYRGAVVAAGGYGKCRWSAAPPTTKDPKNQLTSLAELGLSLDPATGVLQGRLTTLLTPGNRSRKVTIPLVVEDEDPATAPVPHRVEMLILPPMQFIKPE